MKFNTVCLTVFLFFLSVRSFSQNLVVLSDTVRFIRLEKYASFAATDSEYILPDHAEVIPFEQVADDQIFLDGKSKNYWVRISMHNTGLRRKYLLEAGNPTINKISLYETDGKQVKTIVTGDSYPFYSRGINYRTFVFEIDIPTGEKKDFYFFIDTEGDKAGLPLSLNVPVNFTGKISEEQFIFGVFFGLLFLMVILHLFFLFNLKDFTHLYYLMYVMGFAIILLSLDGLLFQFFLPENPWLADRMLVVSVYFTICSLILFVKKYLETRKLSKLINHLLTGAFLISTLFFILCFTTRDIFNFCLYAVTYFAPLVNLLAIITAVISLRGANQRLAKYFLLAFLLLIIGVIMVTLKSNGILTSIPFRDQGLKLGVVAQIITLSFALTVRFKMQQEATQALALQHLQKLNELKDEQNVKLERMVNERTQEINKQKEIIEKKNTKITDSIRLPAGYRIQFCRKHL
jgi:two-component system, sensor histidine kinase LadS